MTSAQRDAEYKKTITAFGYVVGDDGKTVIAEFVAPDRSAFAEILKDPTVRVFDKRALVEGKLALDQTKLELQKVKKDFDWAQLRVAGN